jgi:valyl-tRNA synthetase
MVAAYPEPEAGKADVDDEAAMGRLMRLVTAIRTVRATYEVDRKRRIDVTVVAADEQDRAFVTAERHLVRHLAGLERFEVVAQAVEARGTIKQPVDALEVRIGLAGLFDVAAETARLGKERAKVEQELASLQARLENPQFAARAKPEVVAQSRERVRDLEDRRRKIDDTLRTLGEAS